MVERSGDGWGSVLGLLRFSTTIKNVFESTLGGWKILGYDHLNIFKKTNFVKIVFEHGLKVETEMGTLQTLW